MSLQRKKQSRIAGAVYLVAAQAVVLVFGYVTHLWIGRKLGPEAYGIYGVVLSVQTIIGLLLTLGVPVAVSRYVSRDEEHARSILREGLRIQTVVAAIVGLVTFMLSPLLAGLLRDSSLMRYIQFSAMVVMLQAYYPIFTQYLSALRLFTKQSLLTLVYASAKLVGALSLVYVFHIYGAFAGFAVGGLVAGSLGWYWTRQAGGRQWTHLPYKAFLQFAGIYVLILVGLQILISLDLFMVKALLRNDTQAGYYNAAVTLSRIPYVLLQALAFVLLPSVSALTKSDQSHTRAVEFITDAIRYLIALIVPGVALAAATSRALVSLFFSNVYAPAAPVLTVLMVGLGSLAFYLLLINMVAGAGKAKVGLYVTGGLLVVSCTLGFVLVPTYGLMGAAWQTTLTGLTGLTIIGAYTFKTFRMPFPYKSTFNILAAAAVAVLPTYFWQATPSTLIWLYLLSGLIYVATLIGLREISHQDRLHLSEAHPLLSWLKPK